MRARLVELAQAMVEERGGAGLNLSVLISTES